MKPKALLIYPPIYDFALFDLFLKPYGLLNIGYNLQKWGYEVELLNCLDYKEKKSIEAMGRPLRRKNGTGKFFRQTASKPEILQDIPRNYGRQGILREVMEERIKAARPDVILISSGMTYWYEGTAEAAEAAKSIFPRVPLIIGGVYATLCEDHCRKRIPHDRIIRGEAFPAISTTLSRFGLPSENHWDDGILLDKGCYSDSGALRLNRGCPFRCQYCSSFAISGPFQAGSAEKAFELVRNAWETWGTRFWGFYDDALLVKKQEILFPFLRKVINSKLPLEFYLPNAIHLSFIDSEAADLMFKAGIKEVRIGFESSSDTFHNRYDNKFDPGLFHEKIGHLLNAGFKAGKIALYILAGLPGQSKEEVEESIRYASRFGVNVYLCEYSPVPGSSLWDEAVKQSSYPLAEEPLTHNNSIFPMASKDFTLKDLNALKNIALKLCRHKQN